ncbi:MAG TPA: molecular chaperone DnaJ, partial [Pseudoduganella sp.]
MTIWHTLGIAPTQDTQALKLAYAARLKLVKPADGPGAVQALRAAYQQALAGLATPAAPAAPAAQPSQPG